jgi:hypothetical protein
MKFRLYKHRTAAHVKVPLATPEIIELNEITPKPFAIQEYYETSSHRDDFGNSSSSTTQTRGKNYLNYFK